MFRRDQASKIALERLEERFEALADAQADLERQYRKLQLEWVETYDKVRHQLSRMAKRGTLPGDTPPGPNDAPVVQDEPGMDPVSAKIHERRNRSFLRPPPPKE